MNDLLSVSFFSKILSFTFELKAAFVTTLGFRFIFIFFWILMFVDSMVFFLKLVITCVIFEINNLEDNKKKRKTEKCFSRLGLQLICHFKKNNVVVVVH